MNRKKNSEMNLHSPQKLLKRYVLKGNNVSPKERDEKISEFFSSPDWKTKILQEEISAAKQREKEVKLEWLYRGEAIH